MAVTRLREKGQVTIPAPLRKALGLVEDTVLTIAKAGDSILISPQPSLFDSTAKKFSKQAKKKGITLNRLLKDLRKLRQE